MGYRQEDQEGRGSASHSEPELKEGISLSDSERIDDGLHQETYQSGMLQHPEHASAAGYPDKDDNLLPSSSGESSRPLERVATHYLEDAREICKISISASAFALAMRWV